MNEKIDCLNLFFQHGRDHQPLFLGGDIAAHLLALMRDVERRRIPYGNDQFRDFQVEFLKAAPRPDRVDLI